MALTPTTLSGVKLTDVRISNFRSLQNVEVQFDDLTVLVGANNSGKTSFLDALYIAIGSGRKQFGQDDILLAPEESFPPKDRTVLIDIKVRPVGNDGGIINEFPKGSFWTGLWGTGIVQDVSDFHEFMGIRTSLSWNQARGEYVLNRNFIKEWKKFNDWLISADQGKNVLAAQIEPIALHYIDAKRDLDDDLHKQGSFWRRLTDDLGLSEVDIRAFEEALTELNKQIVDKSEILKHLKSHLGDMQSVVSADSAGIDISPVARRLRDLSKGVDVSFATTSSQSFPLTRHGMGTRSLASLLVFRAYTSWKNDQATKEGVTIHSLLALEEPEAHLHPQAQRSMFTQIKAIPGQRIVSSHSPYFAGQVNLSGLRLFTKNGGNTTVTKLDLSGLKLDDIRKLEQTVIESRGDLLFARAVIYFEGQTEEQALPIWAEKYWGANIHELGFSFVRVNGTDYFPYVWMAEEFGIPWYVLGDGEDKPIEDLKNVLKRIGYSNLEACPNVLVYPDGKNFETQLLAEGYLSEIENVLDEYYEETKFLDNYINNFHGKSGRKGVPRDYLGENGRLVAAIDAIRESKTRLSKKLATKISNLPDPARRFPSKIAELFQIISKQHDLEKSESA